MSKVSITIWSGEQEECRVHGEDEVLLVYPKQYKKGDKLVFTAEETPGFYIIRVDGAMDEAYVYLTGEEIEYPIPFEEGNPFHMDRISYHPGCFAGERHYITMRRARPQENENYRNLAKNVMDWKGALGCYPHVRANVQTAGPVAPLFAPRNVIDGVLANASHYPWPYQSWGIDQREDAQITLEFGRPVDMDELRLTTRADFPHDSWWVQGTVTFSDGTSEVLSLEKTEKPQVFTLERRGITWLQVGELKKADDPSPFPALTQIQVFGRNSGTVHGAGKTG